MNYQLLAEICVIGQHLQRNRHRYSYHSGLRMHQIFMWGYPHPYMFSTWEGLVRHTCVVLGLRVRYVVGAR